jgi:hypothetical protein
MLKTRNILVYLFIAVYSFAFSQNSLHIIKPQIKGNSSFAIIIDSKTYVKIGPSVDEYKKSVEKNELPCYIVCADWKTPEEVKKQIKNLYDQQPKLEGVVFIGDIPIVMVRDAQHFASAFKMDQDRYKFIRSSIPSDRFYDDFDLEFKFLKRDSLNSLINYYSLLSSSPAAIEKDIYSARIKSTLETDEKYDQLDKYLKKLVRVKSEKNVLNKFLFGCGEGYVSDSHDAFVCESDRYEEYFPLIKEYNGTYIKLFHKVNNRMKDDYLSYLKIDDLDLALLTAHGEPDYEYIKSIKSKDTTQVEKDKAFILSHLVVDDVRKQKINTRVMINNSCFNGAFINAPYIAGEYIFSDGNCVTSCANTVNVLQDIWTLEDAGLLEYGARMGQWHKNICYLESHLFGDPTFSFTPAEKSDDIKFILQSLSKADIPKLKDLAVKSKTSVVRSLALVNLYKLEGNNIIEFLSDRYKKDNSAEVRTMIIKILARSKSKTFEDILLIGVNDPSEFIRRISIKILGEVGREEFIPVISKSMIYDPSERVVSSAETALSKINPSRSREVMLDMIEKDKSLESDTILSIRTKIGFKSKVRSYAETDSLFKFGTVKKKITEIRSLRGNRAYFAPDALMKMLSDKNENITIRLTCAEALGWYSYQYNWKNIVDKLDDVLKENGINSELKDVIITAKKRLLAGPNHPLTP